MRYGRKIFGGFTWRSQCAAEVWVENCWQCLPFLSFFLWLEAGSSITASSPTQMILEVTIGDNEEAFELPGMILKADPNPVPSGPERVKTTITWSAPGHRVVQIFVGPPGSGGEKLFVEYGGRGSAEVDFVVPDQQYEFRMYGGKDKKELLAVLRIPKK